MSDDHDIVEAVLAGRAGAFERLIERHQRMVWHLIVRMVKHPDDADDLAQETFLQVHRKLPQFRFESALSTWIGQIAFSLAGRFLQRKRLPLVEASEGEDDVLERIGDGVDLQAAFADAELFQHVGVAMEQLPAIQRTLLTLFHLDELPLDEISTITGLPVGTIKSYLFRARARLRAELESRVGVAA